MTDEQIIYDILSDGIGLETISEIALWLLGALAVAAILWRQRRWKKRVVLLSRAPSTIPLLLFCGWLGLAGLGFGNVVLGCSKASLGLGMVSQGLGMVSLGFSKFC